VILKEFDNKLKEKTTRFNDVVDISTLRELLEHQIHPIASTKFRSCLRGEGQG
jgi:hypothetical protein